MAGRKWLVVGLLVGCMALVGAALVTVGAVVVTSRSGPTEAGATPAAPGLVPEATRRAEPIPLPLPEAEDGGQVQIVEDGFTLYQEGREQHRVTWGLVVANHSQHTPALVEVDVDVVDDRGRSVLSNGPAGQFILVMPGRTVGVGGSQYVTGPEAAELVTAVEPGWWPVGNDVRPVAEVEVSDVTPSREDPSPRPDDPLTLEFRVDSGYGVTLESPYVHVLLRDQEGELVGGLNEVMFTRIPPGLSSQRLLVHDDLPASVDLHQTEIYLPH